MNTFSCCTAAVPPNTEPNQSNTRLRMQDYSTIDWEIAPQWYDQIILNKKTVEGKLNKGKAANIKAGDMLHIWSSDDSDIHAVCEVEKIVAYESIKEYLEAEGVERTVPAEDIITVEDGIRTYRQYYSEEMEQGVREKLLLEGRRDVVLAIHIEYLCQEY